MTEQTETASAGTPAQPDPMAMLRGWMREIVGCTMRGALSTLANRVTGQVILIEFCHAAGVMIGGMFVGDAVEVSKFRKICRDAFKDGMMSVPVAPMSPAPTESATILPSKVATNGG